MQRGTPLGSERHYSWRADGQRSEASSPPQRESTGRPDLDATGAGSTVEGVLSCLYSTSTRHDSPCEPTPAVPWGRRFRLWKFRYKVVRHKKKRSSRPHTEAEDNTHPQHRRADRQASLVKGPATSQSTWSHMVPRKGPLVRRHSAPAC